MFVYLYIQSALLQDQLSGFDVTAHRQQGVRSALRHKNNPCCIFQILVETLFPCTQCVWSLQCSSSGLGTSPAPKRALGRSERSVWEWRETRNDMTGNRSALWSCRYFVWTHIPIYLSIESDCETPETTTRCTHCAVAVAMVTVFCGLGSNCVLLESGLPVSW